MNETTTGVRFHVTITRNLSGSWFMGDRWRFEIRDSDGRLVGPGIHHAEHATRMGARIAARKHCRALAGVGAQSERWTYEAEADR